MRVSHDATIASSPLKLMSIMAISILVNALPSTCSRFCGQSHDGSQLRLRVEPPIERSLAKHDSESLQRQGQQIGQQVASRGRQKRSPSEVRNHFDFWNTLEVLFAAYQMNHRPHDDSNHQDANENLHIEDPTSQHYDQLDPDRQTTSDSDERQPRHPRVAQPADSSQFLSTRQRPFVEDDRAPQASQPAPPVKVIETAVFIDQALDNKFTGRKTGLVELNKLVLTIMNQVQYLFEYSSLQAPIKLKLVLVEHLKESERLAGLPSPNSERGDIDAYLSNFCNWQQSRLDSEKRLWWDHAILLSGLDLYKATPGKNHSGVLGLAWVGGMCKGNYSCTINEASNFESAFVIAHEIGHSLGIMHDGQRNRCDPNQFIMSERTGAGKVHWSKCSNSYLNDSIQRGQLKCLDSEQNNQIDSLYDLTKLRAPGQVYPIDEQCRLAFGTNYTSMVGPRSPFNAVCRELWCVSGNWAKAAHPALEGSSCDQLNLVCREGKCVAASQ